MEPRRPVVTMLRWPAIPLLHDELEDRGRAPADERDLYFRLQHLDAAAAVVPTALLIDGVVQRRGGRVRLSPIEAALAEVLLTEADRLVPRDIPRRRRRLADVSLTITAVPGRGYVLHELADPDAG